MMQIEKNKILAEYLNIDFDKLCFAEKCQWHNNWNNLMKVAIKLKEDTYYDCPVNFTENHLSFDNETLFENCFNMIEELKKQKKL